MIYDISLRKHQILIFFKAFILQRFYKAKPGRHACCSTNRCGVKLGAKKQNRGDAQPPFIWFNHPNPSTHLPILGPWRTRSRPLRPFFGLLNTHSTLVDVQKWIQVASSMTQHPFCLSCIFLYIWLLPTWRHFQRSCVLYKWRHGYARKPFERQIWRNQRNEI